MWKPDGRGVPRPGSVTPPDAPRGYSAGWWAGSAGTDEPVLSLLKASSLVYFLGLVASQRELFQVGRDLNAQTGNLSPLVAAGLFYLALHHPADSSGQPGRSPMRQWTAPAEEDPLDVAASQEMV